MGLALYNYPHHPPSFPLGGDDDADEDGLEGLGLCQHRYLAGHAGPSSIDPTNPKARHVRKPFKWSSEKFANLHFCALQLENDTEQTGDALPEDWLPHHILAARSTPAFQRNYDYFFRSNPRDIEHSRGKANQSKKLHFEDECKEARALARDGRVRLPYDGERQRSSQRRPPSLERQDAFRDGRTAKRKRLLDEADIASDEELRMMGLLYDDNDGHHRDQDAQQDKELYAMGLLYDDEHLRGERFSLQTIQREQPVYAIKACHKKDRRRRKSQKLDMTLEFSVLGEDKEIAALLAADGDAESCACSQAAMPTTLSQRTSPGLTVIYELVGEENEEKEEEEEAWDMVIDGEGCNENDGIAAPAVAEVMVEITDLGSESGEEGGRTTDPWVVLGH